MLDVIYTMVRILHLLQQTTFFGKNDKGFLVR